MDIHGGAMPIFWVCSLDTRDGETKRAPGERRARPTAKLEWVKRRSLSSCPRLRLGSQPRGITEAALIEAAGGDLNAYMRAELNRAVDRLVEDRVARD
jgi:hypothetical protein